MKTKFEVGQSVKCLGVKDAVVTRVVKVSKKPGKTLYCIQYTVDDELERECPTGKRYTQPRFENEIEAI